VPPKPSRRFQAVLGFLRPAEVLVDVGTDHGLLPLFALEQGLARRAIGIDRAEATRAQALAHAGHSGLAERADFRIGDGLAALAPGELGEDAALTLCGLGGRLAVGVLNRGAGRLGGFAQLVVQPNAHAEAVRAWARAAGWHLAGEALVAEARELFPVLAFRPGAGPDPAYAVPGFTAEELEWLGPKLLEAASPEALAYYEAQRARLAGIAARGGRTPSEPGMWARAIAHAGRARA
jgi:tRNA (adenine22-N1)-methyltransferase